ncbi:hypothetical protein [Nocardioides sp. R-C-SC26]|uniref:hypothetical protein n=1 Tax=Nocardioides sp. R-C-SC26 TaxID=2870414 RepID=UPI001E2E8C07|nr:hypothetical protein [Nocardioides sp. R-C-SC26]
MHASRIRLGLVALLGLALLGLSACGEETSPAADRPAGAAVGAHEHPTGADDVVLRILTAGGYTSMDYQFAIRPTIVLYGDGRVLATDPDDGDARLWTVREGRVDEAQVQEILSSAAESGLLAAAPSYDFDGGFMVTDNPTTTVEIAADGGPWVHEIYALSSTQGDTPARQRLRDFVGATTDALGEAADGTYEPEQLRLFVTPVSGDDGAQGAEVVEWPTGGPALAGEQGCRVVDAAGLTDLLGEARLGTYVRQGDRLFAVTAAAVLPGETRPCADW